MKTLKDQLVNACAELGLKIDVEFTLSLEGGFKVHSVARIPTLGATNGMLIIRSFDEVEAHSDELIKAGYGYSVLDEPGDDEGYDLDGCKNMFVDWGWSGDPRSKPAWMEEYARSKMESLLNEELEACTKEQQEVFKRYRVPLRKASLIRYGNPDNVFVVAQRDKEVLYYEDIEQGFNFSPLAEDGSIKEHWCSQDELKYALNRWVFPDSLQPPKLGPAQPI